MPKAERRHDGKIQDEDKLSPRKVGEYEQYNGPRVYKIECNHVPAYTNYPVHVRDIL